jgi:hypothetical protein
MSESKKKISEEISENSKELKNKEPKEVTPAKPKPKKYLHIDTFLLTAKPLYKMSNMQVAGFKMRMKGQHYQYDEQVFINELKKYLDIN